MALTKLKIEDIMKKYQMHPLDTGSTGVQIIQLTRRVQVLTKHLKNYKNDTRSRYALTSKVVSLRRRLMKYLKRKNPIEYLGLISALEIRG